MTPKELAALFTPHVQKAAENAKQDILYSLPPLKRMALKMVWGPSLKYGIPIGNRIVIELLIDKYRDGLAPMINKFFDVLEPMLDDKIYPELRLLHEIIQLFQTPRKEFHVTTQEVLFDD